MATALAAGPAGAAEPPAPREAAAAVDAAIDASMEAAGGAPAPACDDAAFLRRAWLDLTGDIPTPEHVIAFALDRSAEKRGAVIRALLADPHYGLNWARYWRDVILARRIEDRALAVADALEADLSAWLNADEPWDRIAARFITAEGDVREEGATALAFAQDGRTEEFAAETSRIFLGIQLQCAQCHDHPYDSWKRGQFHELAAFFPRVGVRPVQTTTRRSFEVFASDRPLGRRPNNENRPQAEHRMPDLNDPAAPGTTMAPRFFLTGSRLPLGSRDAERRATLADWLTESPWFSRAVVNRLWSELAGEGFYEPVDDLGPERPLQAEEALEILASGFAANGFSLKWLMETICLTTAYQRESRGRRLPDDPAFTANVAQPLRGDQLFNALLSTLDMPEPADNGQPRAARNATNFRRRFGETFFYDPSDPRETVAASIPQALLLMNSPSLQQRISGERPTWLASLLAETDDPEQIIAEIYLRALSRPPRDAELATAVAYLGESPRLAEGAEDLCWALINSAEFRSRR
jgi:hypothetical protein